MSQLTTKECGAIEESLYDEHLLGEKCRHWAAEVNDQTIVNELNRITDLCQTHFQQLTELLRGTQVQ